MSARVSLAVLALAAFSVGKPQQTTAGREWFPLHPRTHEPALAALLYERGMSYPNEPEPEDHPLAMGIWPDGTLVWCGAGGGAYGHPYHTATVGADAAEELRSSLVDIMLEREGKRSSFEILDTSHEVLVVRQGDRAWRMRSCIDLFEANPKLVAFAHGVGAREQMPAIRADDPEELDLQGFRAAWARAKQLLLSAVPNAGEDANLKSLEYAWVGAERP